MKTEKITAQEIKNKRISALPTRPNAPMGSGGVGYTAEEMKAAFDRLPEYIIQRFNMLIDDIKREGEDSVAGEIKTGIKDGHSLYRLCCDLKSGEALSYIMAGEVSLAMLLCDIQSRLSVLEGKNEQI